MIGSHFLSFQCPYFTKISNSMWCKKNSFHWNSWTMFLFKMIPSSFLSFLVFFFPYDHWLGRAKMPIWPFLWSLTVVGAAVLSGNQEVAAAKQETLCTKNFLKLCSVFAVRRTQWGEQGGARCSNALGQRGKFSKKMQKYVFLRSMKFTPCMLHNMYKQENKKNSGQPFIINLTATEDCFQLVPKYELKVKQQRI